MMQQENTKAEHAIVLGASMGGLMAARALTEHFTRVTLVDRDELPAGAVNRKGVPQGRHSHALLAKGGEVLEHYFPGLTQELVAEGVAVGDTGLSIRLIAGGQRVLPCAMGRQGLAVSRPLLEWAVRKRLLELPSVCLLDRHVACGLVMGPDDHVKGIRIAPNHEPLVERELHADLVVDASGRGSKTPEWLRQLGFLEPEEESVHIGVSYVTRHFRRRPSDLGGDLGVIISAAPPNPRTAAVLAQEGDRWTVTLAGYLGERAPMDLPSYIEFARGLPQPDVYDLVSRAEPLGEPVSAAYPASVRRRYERLRRFPERYVTIADAICGFNPIFGQGMTVAAIEATLLDATLAAGLERVGMRFFARAKRPIDAPWGLVVGNDLRFPAARGRRTFGIRLINAYLARYLRAAAHDAVLSRAFREVSNLTLPPEKLMSPTLLSRVLLQRRDTPLPVLSAASTPARS